MKRSLELIHLMGLKRSYKTPTNFNLRKRLIGPAKVTQINSKFIIDTQFICSYIDNLREIMGQ